MRCRENPARYAAADRLFTAARTLYLAALLFFSLRLGYSRRIADLFLPGGVPFLPGVAAYLAIGYASYYLLSLPLTYAHSFLLEHRFGLSNQNRIAWLKDQLKEAALSYLILVLLAWAFFYSLARFPHTWWLAASIFWFFFSAGLARILPVVIIPLFFKYSPLADEALTVRIRALAESMGIGPLDCFQIDFSAKTRKANAALVGWGKTRRVLLADTLKDSYSVDEITVIVAHEFAHYRQRHLVKLIAVNALLTAALFITVFITAERPLGFFGFASFSDIASLPVLLLYFLAFSVISRPLVNSIGRAFERSADRMALLVTGQPEAFISMMEKLGAQNLAERSPHPLVKFFFFDHPPLDERIAMAQSSRKENTAERK